MINAFGVCRSIATKHEEMIGQKMLEMAMAEKPSPALPQRSSKFGNVGTNEAAAEASLQRWFEIAGMIRDFLKDNPGASTVDIREALGINRSTVSSWTTKMRMNQEQFGITARVVRRTKLYAYWRSEDFLKGKTQ